MKQMTIFDIVPDEFGGAELATFRARKTDNYEDFVAKFDEPKTTDDCYTPPEVYDVILDWVKHKFAEIEGKRIVRPFYPGGDYEHYDYTDAVVVDNPPFSIGAQIVRFYQKHNVPFFLFCPYLTCFNFLKTKGVQIVVTDARITYHNGAQVSTSFVTNLYQNGIVIEVDNGIKRAIFEAQKGGKVQFVKLRKLDGHLFNSTRLAKCDGLALHSSDFVYNPNWEFGGGIIVNDEQAAAAAAAAAEAEEERENRYIQVPLTLEQELCLAELNAKGK